MVYSVAYDSTNQKLYVGGNFTSYNDINQAYLIRLNSDGSYDSSFSVTINNTVNAIAYDSGGQKIYIGGWFSSCNGVTRNYLARLNYDGTLDTTFANTSSFGNQVKSLFFDGVNQKLYVGGDFNTTYNGTPAKYVARFNIDGSIDSSFIPTGSGLNGNVKSIVFDSADQKLYVGGNFSLYNGTSRNYIARLTTTGSLDTSFAPTGTGLNNFVNTIAYDSVSQKIYVGGGFNTYNGVTRNRFARLNNDGSLDTNFDPTGIGFNNTVSALVYDSVNQKIYVGGPFTAYLDSIRNRVAKLNTDGSIDPSFAAMAYGFNAAVTSFIFDSTNQKIYVGGKFTAYSGTSRNRIARLNLDGSLDLTFSTTGTGIDNDIYALAFDSTNQKIYVGGSFTSYNGTTRNRIARLNSDGSLDTGFVPVGTGLNNIVSSIFYDSVNQKIYVGGYFTSYNGANRYRIARLNNDGSLDTAFSPPGTGFNSTVYALAYDSANQKIYAGGYFTSFNGTNRNGIALLTTTGSLDTTFTPATYTGQYNRVTSLLFDSANQKIYVGGNLSPTGGGAVVGNFIRLDSSGSQDTSFNSNNISNINSIIFDSVRQKIYAAGSFIYCLNTDGSSDNTFVPFGIGFNYYSISALAYDNVNQKIYVGGDFNSYNSVLQNNFSKLKIDASLSP